MISVPVSESGSRVMSRNLETLAILGTASPRKPRVWIAARSSFVRIFEVAFRSRLMRASSRFMPQPSSVTRISEMPPRWTRISMLVAPASMLFSTSSLTTEAGRSTTSPAATWLARASGSRRIFPIVESTSTESGAERKATPKSFGIGRRRFYIGISIDLPIYDSSY